MVDNITTDGNDKWKIFRYFLGDWTGNGTGNPGDSSVERSYALTLSDQFIESMCPEIREIRKIMEKMSL